MELDWCNQTQMNATYNLLRPKLDRKVLYMFLCPAVILICFFSIILNASLIGISRQSKYVNKSPILLLSLNLAMTDMLTSILNALSIFITYLDLVHGTKLSWCLMLLVEMLRCSALLASALHLLALAFVHYRGTVNPLHYRSSIFFSRHLSRTINIISICCWLLPLTLMILWFYLTPCQGFQSERCDFIFLLTFTFRYMILTVFSVPLLLMSTIYLRIFMLISRHQKGMMAPANDSAANLQSAASQAVAEERPPPDEAGGEPEGAESRRCLVCSLRVKAESDKADDDDDGDDDDDQSDGESVSILSEEIESGGEQQPPRRPAESARWTGSGQEEAHEAAVLMNYAAAGDGASRARGQDYAAVIQRRDDDSYTIRNSADNNNHNHRAKSRCNGIPDNQSAEARANERPASGQPVVAAVTDEERPRRWPGRQRTEADIDYDPKGQPRKSTLVFVLGADRVRAEREPQQQQQQQQQDRHDLGADDLAPTKCAVEMMPTKLNCERRQAPASGGPLVVGPPPLADHASATGGLLAAAPMQTRAKSPSSSSCSTTTSSARIGTSQLANGVTPAPPGDCLGAASGRQSPSRAAEGASRAGAPLSSMSLRLVGPAGDSLCATGSEPQEARRTATSSADSCKWLARDGAASPHQDTQSAGGDSHAGARGPLKNTKNSDSSSASSGGQSARAGSRAAISGRQRSRRPKQANKTAAGQSAPATCTCDNKLSQSAIESLYRSNTVACAEARGRTTTTTTTRLAPSSGRPKAPICAPGAESSISSSFAANSSLRFQLARPPSAAGDAADSGSGSSGSGSSCDKSRASGKQQSEGSLRARLARQSSGGRKPGSLHATGLGAEAASLTVTTLTSGRPTHNFSTSSSFQERHRHHHHHHHHYRHHREPQRGLRKGASVTGTVPATNTKALVTTLLILGTYFISYLPAIGFQALTCIDSVYCPYPLHTVGDVPRLIFGTATTVLLITKSIVDPIIYSYRMNEIKLAIKRYMSKRRSKSSSRATSLYTSQRLTYNGGGGGGGGAGGVVGGGNGLGSGQAGTQTTQQTNFTGSFKILNNASVKGGASSRTASIRISQHHFDRAPALSAALTEDDEKQAGAKPTINGTSTCAERATVARAPDLHISPPPPPPSVAVLASGSGAETGVDTNANNPKASDKQNVIPRVTPIRAGRQTRDKTDTANNALTDQVC